MRPLRRPRSSRRAAINTVVLFALLAVASGGLVVVASPASGYAPATVKVVLERIEERGCTDSTSGADFYADIAINGQTKDFARIDGKDTIDPNWTHEVEVDTDEFATVPIRVRVGEFDNFMNFGDDQCDLTPGPGDDLELTLDTRFCDITGHVTGTCGQLETTGGGGESVFLRFRVDVIRAPVPEAGVGVRCLHSPLWPQPGDDVKITAEALDAALQVGDTYVDESNHPNPAPPLVDRTVTADEIEIWVDGQPAKYTTDAKTATFQVDDVPAGDLVYSCRVRHQTEESFTGWRRTRVGPPAQGDAVPVVYTGHSSARADIVFIADTDDYAGPDAAAFLDDARDVILGAYHGQDYFLARQRDFNFWLADEVGNAERDASDKCILTEPDNWDEGYSFADAGAILHTARFRDCASPSLRLFSTEPDSVGTVLHETGHQPFGLADEYEDDGGYWQDKILPNVYESKDACEADAPDLGRDAAECRSFVESVGEKRTIWLSEPADTDLMNSDRHPPQAADIRRIDWFFDQCALHEC